MVREIELWRRVSGDPGLLDRAAGVDPSDVSAVSSLRKLADPEAVSVALALTAARAKAVTKFGPIGASLMADVAGVEQASGSAVAAYKAARVRAAPGGVIADLCCGIGGDAMALADAGLSVITVDRDPLRAWMAYENTGRRARPVCADVAGLRLTGTPIHLDPARRDESAGRRTRRLEDYQPGPEVIGRLIGQASGAAVKLSPGIDTDTLPWPGEIEFISDHGRLVQAVLWTGRFAHDERRATRIDNHGTHTIGGEPAPPLLGPMGRYVYTFDAAVERAGLTARLSSRVDAPAVHPRLGLLSSDTVIHSPWLTGFELIERMAWRPKRVRQWLAANDAGLVEVKTRGKACDPDTEQRRLRGRGATTYTVFVLRFDTKVEALVTRRL